MELPFLRRLAIRAYQGITTPVRAQQAKSFHQKKSYPIPILFFHRVANHNFTPWTITREQFAEHIRFLEDNFEIVSLSEVQERMRRQENPKRVVAITFDDGYGENAEFAIPFLIERGIPCTYFVSTNFALSGKPFPHDVALGVPARPNTIAELRSFADNGIEIGAHTRTHADIGKITNPHELFDEIIHATEDLRQAIGHPLPFFAFPFGHSENMSPSAFKVAHDAGFRGVCSAYGGYCHLNDNPFHLQRIHGDSSLTRLKNWLSWDPKQLRIRPSQHWLSEITYPTKNYVITSKSNPTEPNSTPSVPTH